MAGVRHLYDCDSFIGAQRFNAAPGSRLAMPVAPMFPYSAGNHRVDINFVDGLRFPVLTLVPAGVYAAILRAATINAHFITRSSSPGNDLTNLTGNALIHDGATTFELLNVKGCVFTFGASFPNLLRASYTYFGTDVQAGSFTRSVFSATPLSFPDVRVAYGAGIDTTATPKAGVIAIDYTVNNGCYPNPSLPAAGTSLANFSQQFVPNEINAGRLTVTGTITVLAHETLPADGDNIIVSVRIAQGGGANFFHAKLNAIKLESGVFDRQIGGAGDAQVRVFQFRATGSVSGSPAQITTEPITFSES
jgi:hypothetical protein